MKLNNYRNVQLCSKALYAEQLKCYATLCECYKALSRNLGRHATSEDVQRRYGKYLTLASEGDLSFTERDQNYIFSENYLGARFQSGEIKIFREYAKQAERLRAFKQGASYLAEAADQNNDVSQDQLGEFEQYMLTASPATKRFYREITEHSPTYIGHQYFVSTADSLATIMEIDSSHLQGLSLSPNFTPSQFGANISGATSIRKIIETTNHLDTRRERLEYAESVSPLREAGYKFFAKNQKGIALSLAAIIAMGTIAGVTTTVKNVAEYNSLSIEDLQERGYKSDLSQGTIEAIKNLENTLRDTKNQGTIPTREQLTGIGSTIDDLFDVVLQEKLAPSFKESHPEARNIVVNHRYDYTDGNDPRKVISIEYTDASGKTQSEYIDDFNSVTFASNDLSKLFDNEYSVDSSYSKINLLFNTAGNYIQNGKDAKKILDTYSENLNFLKHFAAIDLTYGKDGILFFKHPSVTAGYPEKNDTQENSQTNEDQER